MIEFKTLKALVDIYEKCQVKCNSISNKMEKLFDPDTSVMFYWPLDFCAKQIKSVLISEFGESPEGADWFIYEGLSSIRAGRCTEIGLRDNSVENTLNSEGEQEIPFTYYKIRTLEDYYNFQTKNYDKVESVKRKSTETQVKTLDISGTLFK